MGVKIAGKLVGRTSTRLDHGPSASVVETTAPVDNGGDGSRFSPTDLCAASLGSCAATTLALYAYRNGISVSGVEFDVEKLMTPPPRRIGKLRLTMRIHGAISEEEFQKLVEVARTCPVRLSLGPAVEIEESYEHAEP